MERSAESPIGNMPIEAPTGPVIPELSDQPCSNFGMADQLAIQIEAVGGRRRNQKSSKISKASEALC